MTTYSVQLEPSGRSFVVGEDEVILDAAINAGIRMPHGCRAGTCRSCKAKVISGTVEVGRAFPAPAFMLRLRQAEGFTLMCRATAASDVVIEVEEGIELVEPRILEAAIREPVMMSHDAALVRIDIEQGAVLDFTAGQYVDLLLEGGVRRSYSIANPPQAGGVDHLLFHIRHLPGGLFTDPLFQPGFSGGRVRIEAPLGSFYLRRSTKPAILLASGTGFAPIRAILLDTLARTRDRALALYWGGRRVTDLYAMEEAAALASSHDNFSFVPVLSEEGPDEGWGGRTGFVHEAIMADIPNLFSHQVYACGTPAMVEAARKDLISLCRLPEGEFYADSFLSQADLAGAAG